jgi:predicted transcriptional regulator
MARPRSTQPTVAELQILNHLWTEGPSSVRQIYLAIREHRNCGYNATLKIVQIMTDKGLVRRDDSKRPQLYTAAMNRGKMERRMVADLVERLFNGSPEALIEAAEALRSKRAAA